MAFDHIGEHTVICSSSAFFASIKIADGSSICGALAHGSQLTSIFFISRLFCIKALFFQIAGTI